MARETFKREIQEIKDEVLMLGSMAEEAVMESVCALRDNNLEWSYRVIANDVKINQKRYELELSIIVLMATQQPAARDLRTLAVCLDVCTELERIGDYAKAISNINIRSGGLSLPKILMDIHKMGEKTVDMLHRAMTAFMEEDTRTAQEIVRQDDLIDECYTGLYRDAVNSVLKDASNIERANYVIWAAHNLERSGDRATNICERVVYMVTGKIPDSFLMTGQLRPLPDKG